MAKVTNAELKTLLQNNATTTNENFKKAKKAIEGKVDVVEGKGLSTNDFDNTAKEKLNALPTNAELQAGYVAKETGKGLSSNDFTDTLKTKLEGLENVPAVTIEQAATPDEGMAATYQLKVGDTLTGAKINVAKDKFIGTPIIKTCETANTPLTGLKVGDKYVEFPVSNSTEKQYLSVAELYNVYQQGNGILFDGNTIKIDDTVVQTKITSSAKLSADLVDDSAATNKFVTAAEKSKIAEIDNKVEAQDVTDTINDIFGGLSITAWDNINTSS